MSSNYLAGMANIKTDDYLDRTIYVRLKRADHQKLKRSAKKLNTDVSSIVRMAVEAFLAQGEES